MLSHQDAASFRSAADDRRTAAAGPAVIRPLWSQRVRDVPVIRAACGQLALVAGVLAAFTPWPVATALGVFAVVLLGVSAIRIRGRWLSTSLATRIRYLVRARRHDVGHSATALLALLAPGARCTDAVISQPGEVTIVLRPRADVAEFLTALTEPGIGTRLVLHVSPGRREPVRAWLAVAAPRDAGSCTDEELVAVLANTVRRTLRTLARRGIVADQLSEEDVLDTLAALTHTASGRGAVTEQWRYWCTGPVVQSCFRLHGPVTQQILHRLLAAAPTVAITASSAGVLRIAALTPAATDAAATELTYLGDRLGVRLERLDGAHAPAVAATLPIGGTPW